MGRKGNSRGTPYYRTVLEEDGELLISYFLFHLKYLIIRGSVSAFLTDKHLLIYINTLGLNECPLSVDESLLTHPLWPHIQGSCNRI